VDLDNIFREVLREVKMIW